MASCALLATIRLRALVCCAKVGLLSLGVVVGGSRHSKELTIYPHKKRIFLLYIATYRRPRGQPLFIALPGARYYCLRGLSLRVRRGVDSAFYYYSGDWLCSVSFCGSVVRDVRYCTCLSFAFFFICHTRFALI